MISFRYAALALVVAAMPAMAQQQSLADYAPYAAARAAGSDNLLAITDSLLNDTGDNRVEFTLGYGFPGPVNQPNDPSEARAIRYTSIVNFKVPMTRTRPFVLTGMRINYRTQTVSGPTTSPPRVLYTSTEEPQYAVYRNANTAATRPLPEEDSTSAVGSIARGTLPLTTALGTPAAADGYRAPITESRVVSFVPAGQTSVPSTFSFQPGETVTIRVQYFNVPFPVQIEAGTAQNVADDSTSLGCQLERPCVLVNVVNTNGPGALDTAPTAAQPLDAFFDQAYVRALSDNAFVAGEEGVENAAVALGQPYPNPARGMVDLTFALRDAGRARLSVYDVTGRQVAVVTDQTFGSGGQTTQFDTSGLASGVYAIVLEANGQRSTQRLSVVR